MNTNPALVEFSRFDAGGHPDYVADNSLDIHVAWCVWHEGVPLYRDALAIDDFRRQCVSKEHKNGAAANMINNASNDDLYKVLDDMNLYFNKPQNGGYKMVHKHLQWVLHHEGRRADVLKALDAGDFRQIRGIYTETQRKNPHVHHLIQAVDDAALKSLVDSMK